jgi:excisionase family DNA binding protein
MQTNIVKLPGEATLRTKQAARYLGLSHRTLEDWRQTGGGPRFLKLGRAVRYRIRELDQFADERLFANTGEQFAA